MYDEEKRLELRNKVLNLLSDPDVPVDPRDALIALVEAMGVTMAFHVKRNPAALPELCERVADAVQESAIRQLVTRGIIEIKVVEVPNPGSKEPGVLH